MPHHVANANAGGVVRKSRDVKEIAAHHAGRHITMTELYARLSFARIGWKTWICPRHQCLLQLRRHTQIGFHLFIFTANFQIAFL
jgi:hypothetical protein